MELNTSITDTDETKESLKEKETSQSLKVEIPSQEEIPAPQKEPGAQQEGLGAHQEENPAHQEEPGAHKRETLAQQEEPGKQQGDLRAHKEEPSAQQEGAGKQQEKPGAQQDGTGKLQEEPRAPQEESEAARNMRILNENIQSRKRKTPKWKETLSAKPEAFDLKTASKEKKELISLLKISSPIDPAKRTKIDSNDEVIALNDEVKFIFKDENTIKDCLLIGKLGRNYLRRQKKQYRETKERLELYISLIEPFINISKRDYFLLFLKMKSELKFWRGEINPLYKYANVLLFTLSNDKFTYDDITSCLKISKGHLKRMIARMKDLKWIHYHNARTERYYYLTETALQILKDAVEKKPD